jgi:hypothetical protein
MRKRLLSLSILSAAVCLFPVGLKADEDPFEEVTPEHAVSVQCHGRLRHGVAAVGGETTGTTITFHRLTWELQLPDNASRELAVRNHKAQIAVTGRLRKVMGTEDIVRWIVDVEKISVPESGESFEEGAKVTLRGTVRAALSKTGDNAELSVNADNQIWRLDFAVDRRTRMAAESLISQQVLLTGSVLPRPEDSESRTARNAAPETHTVRVKTIEALTDAAADSPFYE